MELKADIRDDQIKASSYYQYSEVTKPWNGRLNNYGDWSTASQNALDPWIQVNLTQKFIVTGVTVQGSGAVTSAQEWVTHLKVQYQESDNMLEYISQNGLHKVIF